MSTQAHCADLARRLARLLGVSLLAGTLAACSHSPAATATADAATETRLEGMLLLKGNAPREVAVLQTDQAGVWQLTGLDKDAFARWQRQRVVVTGAVLRPQATSNNAGPSAKPALFEAQRIEAAP